ncbi:unnamed protein product [Sphagnum balticum]
MSSGICGAQPELSLQRTVLLEDAHNLLAGQQLGAGHSLLVTNDHSDLRGARTLLGHGYDEFGDGLGRVADPLSDLALEESGGGADTFSFALALNAAHV